MVTITINRDELTAIPFEITDAALGLAGKRVTWALAVSPGGSRVLRKVSGLPGSTADITITTQTAGSIVGTINLAVADFAVLPKERYMASLWTDDGSGADRCVTAGGVDTLSITAAVSRLP